MNIEKHGGSSSYPGDATSHTQSWWTSTFLAGMGRSTVSVQIYRLDGFLGTQWTCRYSCSLQGVAQMAAVNPSNPNHAMILQLMLIHSRRNNGGAHTFTADFQHSCTLSSEQRDQSFRAPPLVKTENCASSDSLRKQMPWRSLWIWNHLLCRTAFTSHLLMTACFYAVHCEERATGGGWSEAFFT